MWSCLPAEGNLKSLFCSEETHLKVPACQLLWASSPAQLSKIGFGLQNAQAYPPLCCASPLVQFSTIQSKILPPNHSQICLWATDKSWLVWELQEGSRTAHLQNTNTTKLGKTSQPTSFCCQCRPLADNTLQGERQGSINSAGLAKAAWMCLQ